CYSTMFDEMGIGPGIERGISEMSTTFIFKAVFALIVSTLLAGCGAFAAPTLADSAPAPEQALASRIDQSVVLVKGYEKTTFDDGEAVFHDTYGTGIVVAP